MSLLSFGSNNGFNYHFRFTPTKEQNIDYIIQNYNLMLLEEARHYRKFQELSPSLVVLKIMRQPPIYIYSSLINCLVL